MRGAPIVLVGGRGLGTWFSTARRDAILHHGYDGIVHNGRCSVFFEKCWKRNEVQAAKSVYTQKRSSGEPSCVSMTFSAHGQKMRQCAGPLCDIGMQQVRNGLLEGLPVDQRQHEIARMVESLPMKGSLGIQSTTHGASGLLGVMGRRIAHARNQIAPSCSDRRNTAQQWEAQDCEQRWLRDQTNVVRISHGNQTNNSLII